MSPEEFLKHIQDNRLVRVKAYGSEGFTPRDGEWCPYKDVVCVSSSGDSLCGGYYGQLETHDAIYTICGEKLDAEQW